MIANSVTVWSRRIGLLAAAMAVAVPAWASGADHGGGGGGLPQLDTSTFATQIFWLLVSFLLLYVIMSKIAVPRIADVLAERQERIEDDIETADRLRGEAEAVKAEYERAVADSRSKAEGEAAKKTAETTKAAEARIAEQRTQALSNLKSVASGAAAEATAKLIGIEVGEDKVGAAVDAAMQGGA